MEGRSAVTGRKECGKDFWKCEKRKHFAMFLNNECGHDQLYSVSSDGTKIKVSIVY